MITSRSFVWIRPRLLWLVFAVVVAASFASVPVLGYLKVNPSNPHYFQETTTGKAVVIASTGGTAPSSTWWTWPPYDYTASAIWNGARRLTYGRVWHLLPWEYDAGYPPYWPWARSSTPGAYMGGNKYDFNTWDTTYWYRMDDDMKRHAAIGSYQEIMLFDRCGMSPSGMGRWGSNPWASDNNINSLETPAGSADGTPDFYYYSTKTNLRNQQERYIRKMIDETIDCPNVIYEIENEHWEYNDSSWVAHYAQFVKDYLNTTYPIGSYPNAPRLVSYSSLQSELHDSYTIAAVDIVNQHYGSDLDADPGIANTYLETEWPHNKAMNIDEFANGLTDENILRRECWTILTSGGNFHVEDWTANAEGICENIRSFLANSGWNFINAAPQKSLVASLNGYCMRDVGVEYVCYFYNSAGKSVNMPAGTYLERWWNPRTGGYYNTYGPFSWGGGNCGFTAPNSSDWVLHVTLSTKTLPVPLLDSKAAGSITIDGATTDWSLSQFTTKIRAGDVGQGDTGIMGYDGLVLCAGNHAADASWPVVDAADHSVKIYSRNDATYLYFLARCDDSDMRYSNPTSANWANDCIEIYIDPSNNHGSTGISNSTSDIQLVIDANNQKNVYCTTGGYATQVLGGVTSAVVRDSTGWWMECRIQKSVLDPDIPATGTIGLDFNIRDNDNNNDVTLSSIYSWSDSSRDGFPSKVPDRWGDMNLIGGGGSPPGQATTPNPANGATGVSTTAQLSWTAGSGATSHDVYFGTTSPGTFRGNQAGTTYNPGTLAYSTIYYWRIDEKNTYGTTTGTVWSFTTAAAPGGVSTINVKSAANLNLVINGSSSDWVMIDFTTNSLGGQNTTGDIAVVGFSGGTCYYGGRDTGFALPTSAADHTGKVYTRHDQQYMYFLVRCDDDQMNYAQPTSANWANDCVEIYIDPGHDHGATSISNSTSDLQLVIDCNGQKNVYMCTSGYTTQVLNGVTCSSVRDATGWWMEAKVLKSAIDPDLPASGSFGVDFCFRDNDNPDGTYPSGNPSSSTMYGWRDTGATYFPSKIPDKWGDASLATLAADTTPPAAVTGFTATPSAGQIALAWTNPQTADWAGTQIRFKTTGYPTGPTDGAQIYNSTGSSYNHTGLTAGVTYYYCAYAYDEVSNYATAAQASATVPTGVSWQVQYDGSVLPTAASPAWDYVGNAGYGSVNSGILRVNDTSISQYLVYWKGWGGSNSTGCTVETRMMCDTITSKTDQYDVDIYDGTKRVGFQLTPTQLKCQTTGTYYNLTGNQYHVYRFTLQGTTWNVYLDGNATPIMTGAPANSALNEIDFGSTSFTGKQSVYFDYLYYTAAGAYAP